MDRRDRQPTRRYHPRQSAVTAESLRVCRRASTDMHSVARKIQRSVWRSVAQLHRRVLGVVCGEPGLFIRPPLRLSMNAISEREMDCVRQHPAEKPPSKARSRFTVMFAIVIRGYLLSVNSGSEGERHRIRIRGQPHRDGQSGWTHRQHWDERVRGGKRQQYACGPCQGNCPGNRRPDQAEIPATGLDRVSEFGRP